MTSTYDFTPTPKGGNQVGAGNFGSGNIIVTLRIHRMDSKGYKELRIYGESLGLITSILKEER